MENIKQLRKISYLKLQAMYYQLLSYKEIEFSCLNKNFDVAKEFSNSYFIEPGHDAENLKIYNCEYESLNYCLGNIKEIKRLEEEINNTKIKVLKAELKLKN